MGTNLNTMSKDKIYCGSGKKKNDKWIKITINPDKIKDYIQEYKGNKFVKLDINVFDNENQFGKDVAVSIDTWTPEKNDTKNGATDESDDLPF